MRTRGNTKTHNTVSNLSKLSRLQLRASVLSDEIGDILKDDIRRNPWKVTPLMVIQPIPFLMTGIFSLIMLGTLAQKAASQDMRARFKEAARRPINLQFYDNVLRTCPRTGQDTLDQVEMFKRRKRIFNGHLHHLIELQIDKIPSVFLKKRVKAAHRTISKNNPPALLESGRRCLSALGDAFAASHEGGTGARVRSGYAGRIFALACLANLGTHELADFLQSRDRAAFLNSQVSPAAAAPA